MELGKKMLILLWRFASIAVHLVRFLHLPVQKGRDYN